MNSFGNLVLVDTSRSPYNHSHKLYTSETPANDSSKFHGCIVADSYTPIDMGMPIFTTVWTHMIEGNDTLATITNNINYESLRVYPNPVSSTLNIHCSSCNSFEFARTKNSLWKF